MTFMYLVKLKIRTYALIVMHAFVQIFLVKKLDNM